MTPSERALTDFDRARPNPTPRFSPSPTPTKSGEHMNPMPVADATNPADMEHDPAPAVPHQGRPAPPATNAAAYEAAGELLRALAAPVRIAIVLLLGEGPQCVHDLVEWTGAPQPLVSQHLRVLRGAGVVRGVRRGREIAYSLTDEHIGHIVADAISHAREPR